MNRILLFIIFGLLVACKNKGTSTESQKLYQEIMDIHDEVMPKMGNLRRLSKSLKKIESFETNVNIQKSLAELDEAHESMMSWMAQFKLPKDITQAEEMEFLNGQMKSVNEMKNTMLTAIENAENELSKHNKE